MSITLKLVKTVEGCDHFVALQRQVWGSDALEIVPNHVTVTVIKNGGALLGAYAEAGPPETGGMVGAAFWWPGFAGETLKICSHMAGVLPAWQGQRVGLLLKLRQRELILEQGLTAWVTWTYDPLQRVNAVFNLHRLGATCRTYFRNNYGTMTDALNAGLPTDRFQVDWHLRSARVVAAAAGELAQPTMNDGKWTVLPSVRGADGLVQPVDVAPSFDGTPLAVPIPDDFNAMRTVDAGLGMAWRLYSRAIFEAAFAAGYVASDCVQVNGCWHYLLTPV